MKTCSETYQFEKDLKWENPAPGVNRQIMAYDGQLMMVISIINPITIHRSPFTFIRLQV